jgi:intracellular sulfur oxidation DsrE/DsrF family protein
MIPAWGVLVFAIGAQCPAHSAADAATIPSIPGVGDYVAVPNSSFLATPGRSYRVVFDARHGGDKPTEIAPAVMLAASEINTLAAHNVPRSKVRFAIVFHTASSDEAVLDDAHYKAKYGIANPNLPALARLRAAGVELYVCGQELLADGVPLDAVAKDVTIAEDGLMVLLMLQNDGYALLSF